MPRRRYDSKNSTMNIKYVYGRTRWNVEKKGNCLTACVIIHKSPIPCVVSFVPMPASEIISTPRKQEDACT
jgi:hypothetical protein